MASKMGFEDLQNQIECDMFSLAKWSPMASEINREEFLGLSFSHHMEILHKTKNIDEVLLCIHEAVTHQWDKYTLRNILKAGIPKPDSYRYMDKHYRILDEQIQNHNEALEEDEKRK